MCGEHAGLPACQRALKWIIPACAGSTRNGSSQRLLCQDHPRMCGEHGSDWRRTRGIWGSSPHVRGARGEGLHGTLPERIIPACAGSTPSGSCACSSPGDHPRMCGEHALLARRLLVALGSSPHVRGALDEDLPLLRALRIIPACAGSTSEGEVCIGVPQDHPRMCGEHTSGAVAYASNGGSSPHVRGALRLHSHILSYQRIIPACAGSTLASAFIVSYHPDHPRMCGEHD